MSVLVRRSVTRTLFSMAFPMLAGTFAMNAYSLTDTWFIAQLGTRPLAAMGFIFPVVMLLTCVARGLGSGITALVSHSVGREDHPDAARLVTHGMLLTLAVTAMMSIAGYILMVPIFTSLGADAVLLPLVGNFMSIWYIGAVSMTLPMVGSGVLISMGDSKAASWLMIIGTVINTILNPIMIFGYLGWPAMGIGGSALATVVAQSISTVWLIHLLWRRHRLIEWSTKGLGNSLRRITAFAVPSILSMILMPISATVITKLLSGFGHEAVAASGAASRIEMFAFVVPMALGISLTPFVSQNFGADCMDRVRKAQKVSTWFALSYGGFFLTGMHKPASATMLNAIRVLVLLIPCSYLGAHFWGISGVFGGRLVTDIAVGCIGLVWVSRTLSRPYSRKSSATGTATPSSR